MRADDGARRVLRRWAIAGMASVVVGAAAIAATYTPLFGANDIQLHGAGSMPGGAVLALADIGEGSNVFHLDTTAAERALEADPRILEARVRTSLPDAIVIRIVRRMPVAVVGEPEAMVGADGVVIGPAPGTMDLPALRSEDGGPVSGRGLVAAAAVVGAMGGDLRRDVDAVIVSSEGDLRVRLATGFSAYLGDATELEAKAASLAALLEWADQNDARLVSADLAVPGSPTAELEGGSTAVPTQ